MDVFPEQEEQEAIYYLEKVSKNSLIKIIGFTTTIPQPNYYNFFSDQKIQDDINSRVKKYLNKLKTPIFGVGIISRESSLRIAEIILSNKTKLIDGNENCHNDDDLNLFKAFLAINKIVNHKESFIVSDDVENIEKIAQLSIVHSFGIAELEHFEGDNNSFIKLIMVTLKKIELLFEFFKKNIQYSYLEETLLLYFKVDNRDEFLIRLKELFYILLDLKQKNQYLFNIEENKELIFFVNALVSENIESDEDFTFLKNHPLYKIDEKTYSIIDFNFVVDKFYKSIKFILKPSYNAYNGLHNTSIDFFSFYAKKISEEFIMKIILNDIFDKSYFKKLDKEGDNNGEPDFYFRHNNRVFIFENKDVLFNKKIKGSGNISKIINLLKSKFLTNGKAVGIGQLVNSVVNINNKSFKFDDYVNNKNNIQIYPILLLGDRTLEIPGLNFLLNKWYINEILNKLKGNFKPHLIRGLIVMDIDTLIFGTYFLKERENNFKNILDEHLKLLKPPSKLKALKSLDKFLMPLGFRIIERSFRNNKN